MRYDPKSYKITSYKFTPKAQKNAKKKARKAKSKLRTEREAKLELEVPGQPFSYLISTYGKRLGADANLGTFWF